VTATDAGSAPDSPALGARVDMRLGTLHLDVDLQVAANELVVLVGPNGSGKSSLLRAIAGLTPIDAGTIRLEGAVLDDPGAGIFVPPEKRPVSLMFQDGLLFPHLDALDNVAFGPRARGLRKAAANARALELLRSLGLEAEAHAKPHELSGGQAQRVALARALAVEPRALLLDEPLAALDARTRVDVRRTLRDQLATFAGVRVLVTHDPLEALTLGDRIIVIDGGVIIQTGTADDIRRHPQSPYVAALLGVNLLAGQLMRDGHFELDGGGELQVASAETGPAIGIVDPTAVSLFTTAPSGSMRNCWRTVVTDVDQAPDRVRVHFDTPIPLVADVTPAAALELALAPGVAVWCAVKATAIQIHAR
jgi:molybdate transport system ATP-binding protein